MPVPHCLDYCSLTSPESGSLSPPTLFCFFNIALVILHLLHFPLNFKIRWSIPTRESAGILTGFIQNLEINLIIHTIAIQRKQRPEIDPYVYLTQVILIICGFLLWEFTYLLKFVSLWIWICGTSMVLNRAVKNSTEFPTTLNKAMLWLLTSATHYRSIISII